MGGASRRDFISGALGAAITSAIWGFKNATDQKTSHNLKLESNSESQQNDEQEKNVRKTASIVSGPKRKLETDASEMQDYYDVLIIGSGYGASAVAARLAAPVIAQGKTIAVIERGREWFPGQFPTEPAKLTQNTRNSLISPLGLLDVNANPLNDIDIVGASGLGGTSLINAAITIRPLPVVLESSDWPTAIRNELKQNVSSDNPYGELAKYFERAEKTLGANKDLNFNQFTKASLHDQNAQSMGVPYGQLTLNINHKNGGSNHLNVEQGKCVQCGNCCSGCNYGAKGSLDFNYLALAKKEGAQIFTRLEVTSIVKLSGNQGYKIICMYCDSVDDKFREKKVINAQHVFLGAGSHGSTEILFRSKSSQFKFSSKLGSRLSANGDVLGFGYNGKVKTQMIPTGVIEKRSTSKVKVGQIITTYADYRLNKPNKPLSQQFLLLDGSVPSALLGSLSYLIAQYVKCTPEIWDNYTELQKKRVQLDIDAKGDLQLLSDEGAMNYTMVYLACGHDSSGGSYSLPVNLPLAMMMCKWPDISSEYLFKAIPEEMKKYCQLNQSTFIGNPATTFGGGRMTATHPLGGCPMGDSYQKGVVDHKGRVFDDNGNIHHGLYVVDGAIIPRSLGATPLLTITAMAERIAHNYLKDFIN